MNSHRVKLGCGCLLAVLLAVGCVNTPRNGVQHTSKRDRITFSGLTQAPSTFVDFRMKNFTNNVWTNIAQGATSGTSPNKDALGMNWYAFNQQVGMSTSASLWKRASSLPGQRRVSAEIKASSSVDGNLYTFDTNADACGNAHESEGLMGVINNCASARSPSADVFVNCGRPNQDCCVAHNIAATAACDAGRRCDSASRCTILSGGKNQICNADNTCNGSPLSCIAGMCRDTTIEKTPLVSLDLRVRTCSDATKFSGNTANSIWVDLGTETFYIEVPGNELQPGRTETFGLSPDGIAKVSDITELSIGVHTRDVCFDSIELLANERVVFRKAWSPGHQLWTRYPRTTDHLTIPRDELRTFWTTIADPAPFCSGPTRLSGGALSRRITGLLGHILKTNGEVSGDFDNGGSVTITRVDADTVNVRSRFDATKQVDPIGRVTVQATTNFTLSFACTGGARCTNNVSCADAFAGTCQNSAINIDMSPIDVSISGGLGYDIVNALTSGILDTLVELEARTAINEQAGGLADTLDNALTGLDACPTITVGTTSPPDVSFGYPIVCGLQIAPSSVNICR
jgi:hypothetical protein